MSDEDKYIETQLPGGGVIVEFVNPPSPTTHKTKGLSQTEYRSLFTLTETIKNDECESMINDPSFQISGGVVGLDDFAVSVGQPGFTYRQLMRSGYRAFARAVESGINIDHPVTVLSLNCQALLGLLDSPSRKDTILLGYPL